MIVFHIIFDLDYFDVSHIDLQSLIPILFMYSIATIFLLLVGISLYLSYIRSVEILNKNQLKLKFFLRGIKIFILGLIITVITWIYPNKGFIIFGVLHCIGISIILAYPFLRYKIINLVFGILLIYLGLFLETLTFDFNFLLWLGFKPFQFYTIDYFPLLPWFGVILIGIFIGNTLYNNYERKFYIRDISKSRLVHYFCIIGNHSLIIYFLHQPIILLFLYIFLI